MTKKKKSIYMKKPKGKLILKPESEAERAEKAMRYYDGIGMNHPHDKLFRTAFRNYHREEA